MRGNPRERFLAEIRTTARLQHPHIPPLLDSRGTTDGLVYYVMPFVDGESLRDRLTREKQLPLDDAVRIAREVGDALGVAHAQGVIHRESSRRTSCCSRPTESRSHCGRWQDFNASPPRAVPPR